MVFLRRKNETSTRLDMEIYMTPTEQDKELREKIDELLKSPRYGVSLFAGHRDILVEILTDFITADRKRVALEARIDELENRLRVQFIPSHWARLCAEVNSWAKYVDRRIAELKAQQEEI